MKKIIFFWGLLVSQLSFASIEVLIVGGGPTGLCAAKALQNRGIYPDVIEKEDHIRSDGAGIAIPANGTWALNKLGIDIAEKALRVVEMQFTDDRGEILAQEKIDRIHPDGSQFFSLSRDELIQLLLSSLDKKTQIQTSRSLKRFSEENGKVTVEFSDGKVKSYDFVIGCDGIHSSLRKQVHPDETPEFLNLLVWRTIIDAPQGIAMPAYMLGPDRIVLLYPMPNDKTYVYGHIFQSVKSSPPDSFSNLFSHFGGKVPEAIANLDPKNFYIHHMEKSHSVRYRLDGFSRVLLMGDAAHAFGPMLQNGAAQGFEDAYVLQDLLIDTTSEQIPTLIQTFEKRRLPRVQPIFSMSNIKIQAISDPAQIEGRKEAIRKTGAPNVNGFKLIMQKNP